MILTNPDGKSLLLIGILDESMNKDVKNDEDGLLLIWLFGATVIYGEMLNGSKFARLVQIEECRANDHYLRSYFEGGWLYATVRDVYIVRSLTFQKFLLELVKLSLVII